MSLEPQANFSQALGMWRLDALTEVSLSEMAQGGLAERIQQNVCKGRYSVPIV